MVAQQPTYSAPDLGSGAGTEVLYRYDVIDTDTPNIQDAAGARLDPNAALLWGRAVSVSDRGQKSVFRYDALGRGTAVGVRITKPGTPSSNPADRYATRWYVQSSQLDAAGRPTVSTTGATVAQLLGADGKSELTQEYSRRGVITNVSGSYGDLVTSRVLTADGLPQQTVLGDAAATQRARAYDVNRRLQTAETFRAAPQHWSTPPGGYTPPAQTGPEPTAQLVLEHAELEYDRVGNIVSITDLRVPEEWPDSAKPVTRSYEHDDLYRVTQATHVHSGPDAWVSPFAAEYADTTRDPRPSPQVSFATRVHQQTWTYDWLGNVSVSNDDASGFYDRSIGTQTHGTATAGPHRLTTASNRSSGSTRQGDLATAYDAAGNLTTLIVKRDGPCLPSGASCWQRFRYEWDELGRLVRARRYDLTGTERTGNDGVSEPPPSRAANVDLRYAYAGSGDRVLKTAVDAQARERHTVYVFSTLELRSAEYTGGDYVMDARTTQVRLFAPGVVGRVIYAEESLPTLTSGHQHVWLELGDYLGSATVMLDKATGEVVEARTYQAYGATDASYRPGRWGAQREPYGFTGKEEDVEVGLLYFGARYYAPGLGRWISADPVTVHGARGDLNPYSYVSGRVAISVDPNGENPILIAMVIGAIISSVAYTATHRENMGSGQWWAGLGLAASVGALSGAAGAGVGGYVGGSVASPFWGAVAGGAAGGGTGAAVGYVGNWASASIMANKAQPWSVCGEGYSVCGLALAVNVGGAVGAVSGAIGFEIEKAGWRKPPEEPGKFKDAPDRLFKSQDEAARWAGARYRDRTWVQGREYGGPIYRNADGSYELGDIYVGDGQGVWHRATPRVGQEVVAGWHTHPNRPAAEVFSRGLYVREGNDPKGRILEHGDWAATQRGSVRYNQEDYRTYLATPARNLRYLSAAGEWSDYGISAGRFVVPRYAPAIGSSLGGLGTAAGENIPVYELFGR